MEDLVLLRSWGAWIGIRGGTCGCRTNFIRLVDEGRRHDAGQQRHLIRVEVTAWLILDLEELHQKRSSTKCRDARMMVRVEIMAWRLLLDLSICIERVVYKLAALQASA